MDEASEPHEPNRISAVRAVGATLVALPLLATALAYHDGFLWIDTIAEAAGPGEYRFQAVVTAVDASSVSIRDETGAIQLAWNATVPKRCDDYVVNAHRESSGLWFADAFNPILVLHAKTSCPRP